MASPIISTTGVIARTQADANFNVFQAANAFASAQLLVGNIFFGINGGCTFKFTGAGIPKGSLIKSAVIDVVADATSPAGAVTTQIMGVAMGPDKAWVPNRYGVASPKWRTDTWGTFAADVRNLAAVTIVDTVPGATNAVWGMRQLLAYRLKIAQQFTVPAGPGDTLGQIRLELIRAGAPPGTLSLEIRAPLDGNPEGELLAVSDTVVAAGIPAGPSDVIFTFSGANQIALTGGTTYFVVLKSDLPYPINGVDWIGWRQLRAFLGAGGGRHFGVGNDWDNQNYPGVADVFFDATDQVGSDVDWAMPPFVIGVTYTTPDITDIVQAIVSDQYYQSGGPIGIAFNSLGNPGLRRIAAFDNALRPPAVLRVTYCEPTNDLQGGASYGIYDATKQGLEDDWISVLDVQPRQPDLQEQLQRDEVPAKPAGPTPVAEEPAPAPEVRPQADWVSLVPLAKPPGPPVPHGEPFVPEVRENTEWMSEHVPDTTALPAGARPEAPPTVLHPLGDAGDDLFQTRRIAPPPPADPAMRAVSPYLKDQPANLRQHVYAWGISVLRWEAARRRLGPTSPMPNPERLVVPPEYAWAIATRDRVDVTEAWRRAYLVIGHELVRMIQDTDNPPPEWRQAYLDAKRRGPLPPGASLWQKIRRALSR